ncbi:MAG: hypothetical protein IJN74_03480 [Clostridia bacterium]|nr:hypothetical protein [Clostridia bacterium]
MKKMPTSILCGIVAILLTVILYFTVVESIFAEIICLITLVGVVVAELVVTALAYFSKSEPRKVAATVVLSFMIPIAVALSIVYILNFPEGYGSYLGFYFSAFAILLAISSIIWKFSNNRKNDNDILQNAKTNMLGLRKLVKCVMLKPNAVKFKNELDEIEEKLHFSNDAVILEMDANIRRMLIELDNNIDNENFAVAEHIKAISNEIDRRNIFAKNTI